MRVAVDEARHAVRALKAPDFRAVRAACADGGRPRDTRPVAGDVACRALDAQFPKVAADLHENGDV